MSHVEKITGELRALTAGVERAQGLTAAAHLQAQEIALRATTAGFLVVAAASPGPAPRSPTSRAACLGRLEGSTGEATKAVTPVPQQATPQKTIAALTPVQSAVGTARDSAGSAITRIGETQQLRHHDPPRWTIRTPATGPGRHQAGADAGCRPHQRRTKGHRDGDRRGTTGGINGKLTGAGGHPPPSPSPSRADRVPGRTLRAVSTSG